MVDAICMELDLQKNFLNGMPIETIYLGGGTPSILSARELEKLLKSMDDIYGINPSQEITLEANPDDLSLDKLKCLKSMGINRLSIGIQSFQDETLKSLNRAHNAAQAINSVENARKAGFENLSIDLIFSIPNQKPDSLKKDINQVLRLHPEHVSTYSLTIEEKTVFGNWHKKGIFKPLSDQASADQFDLIISKLEENHYVQYEISNFCRDGHYARHNTSYWKNIPYLGIGPSAHSYDGRHRQANVSNNHTYMKSLASGVVPFERESLSRQDLVNEFILTSLRTIWGCDLADLYRLYQYDLLAHQGEKLSQLSTKGFVEIRDQHIFLTKKGKFVADEIISDLFWV